MKMYHNYIIKSNKSIIELVEYIRKHYEKEIKEQQGSFWKKFTVPLATKEEAAQRLSGYLTTCSISIDTDYTADIINYLNDGSFDEAAFSVDFNLG